MKINKTHIKIKFMKNILKCLTAVTLSGCVSNSSSYSSMSSSDSLHAARRRTTPDGAAQQSVPRMIERRARISVEVSDADAAAETVSVIVSENDGFIEDRSSSDKGKYTSFTLRVPVENFATTIEGLKNLGTVLSHIEDTRDITAEYVDIEARLQSLVALRDRLKVLLDKADVISDVLAIEKEFTRVQAEIDSIEARMSKLENRATLSTIDLSLERKQILGPIGFVGKWVMRGVGVLFVIRD